MYSQVKLFHSYHFADLSQQQFYPNHFRINIDQRQYNPKNYTTKQIRYDAVASLSEILILAKS